MKNIEKEKWGLEDVKRAFLGVSDEEWFQGWGMVDLKLVGPSRANTFRRVFSNVPGAIYGCLRVRILYVTRIIYYRGCVVGSQ